MSDPMVTVSEQRVLLVDDDVRVRVALRRILENDGFSICGEAGDAATAVAVAGIERPDIVLIDVRLPGSGLRAAATIMSEHPTAAIVVLTDSSDDVDIVAAFRLGASGYLLKDSDLERIPHVLRAVLRGETALSRALVGRVVAELRRRTVGQVRLANDRAVRLSHREWEVVELMRLGLSTQQISARLFISKVTVRTHISAVLKKLGVSDRAEALEILSGIETADEIAV